MKISIVIPAYNEEKHIAKVIQVANDCKIADEIIVVDNNSTDNTSSIASSLGAKVVFCKKQGKGYAMETGIKNVSGDIIVFLDGDIKNYKKGFINSLVEPILNHKADFVKASFERTGGRVTELVAKPLLELTYPRLSKFEQPLSGIIAVKTKLIKQIKLDKDYGVDIGILIDLYNLKAKIKQVNIGKITNDSQDWRSLIKMSKQVSSAIIKRSYDKQKISPKNVEDNSLEFRMG